MINESTQAKLKKTMNNYVKNKDKSRVEIKFDDTESKFLERSQNYTTLNKEVTKYQSKVKINREADVLDFTPNQPSINLTAKAIVDNVTNDKNMNSLEKNN